jgi:hypothetical protein
MSKMNWDRVRWENRTARQGSEWASSDGAPPHSSGRDLTAPIGTHSSTSTIRRSKKKKKKKKNKVAKRNMQVPPKGNVAGNSNPNACADTMTQVPRKALGSLKSPPAGGISQVNRPEKAPVFPPKANPNGLRRQHAPDPISVPEIQKLTIRLYKALGENRMLEAASLAVDIHGESLRHVEHAKREKTKK